MVKRSCCPHKQANLFESSVISYSGQTCVFAVVVFAWFESSVISYSGQTQSDDKRTDDVFESSVISYSGQT